jgi:SAM-dependent methyltransferase
MRGLDGLLYPEYTDHWDADLFREEILRILRVDATVLDLGAGDGLVGKMGFRGLVRRVSGVDPDPRVLENPLLDEAKIGRAESIPYPDESFDVVFANNVLEHIESPDLAFREISRVLKPGGVFLAKTPNRWHYVPLIASWTPHWFHLRFNKWRGRSTAMTFPTCYRANSPRVIEKLARRASLDVQRISLIEGRPEYLRLTVPTYIAGWLYERFVNLTPGMSRFRVVMISHLEKPGGPLAQRSAA